MIYEPQKPKRKKKWLIVVLTALLGALGAVTESGLLEATDAPASAPPVVVPPDA